jgi:hypothetical protein
MSATAKKLADQFLAAARKDPGNRPEICRRAAYTFMGLAQDPKNVRSSGQLAQIGMQFATAAHHERPPVMDDFNDLLQETMIAYNEVGDDQMDLVARRREIHDARTPMTPGAFSIAPESFNRDATLGRSAVIKWAPTPFEITQGILQAQNVAFWQGVKKEAQALTVDVSLGYLPANQDSDSFTPSNIRGYAEVEFGSDGNRTKVKLDIGLGKRLTVVGNYVAVTVGVGRPGFNKPSPQFTAGASIGTFAAPSLGPVILTEYIDSLAINTDSVFIPVPLKAVALLPLQSGLQLGETADITFVDHGGAVVSRNFYQQLNNGGAAPIPIVGDAAYVQIRNNANAFAAGFRLPFQLAL